MHYFIFGRFYILPQTMIPKYPKNSFDSTEFRIFFFYSFLEQAFLEQALFFNANIL